MATDAAEAVAERRNEYDWHEFDAEEYRRPDGPMADEMCTYAAHLGELMKSEGQYVLIKGTEVVGIDPTLKAALEAGADKFGAERALTKKIARFEPIYSSGGLAL